MFLKILFVLDSDKTEFFLAKKLFIHQEKCWVKITFFDKLLTKIHTLQKLKVKVYSIIEKISDDNF